jgi:hypothetical protein
VTRGRERWFGRRVIAEELVKEVEGVGGGLYRAWGLADRWE